ncbi:MAG: hypothetical protein AB8B85_01655 [Paracoccaceae bacterium]
MAVAPDDKDPKTGRFKPGNTGAGGGRPKGSRNQLSEAFLADLQDKWKDHGAEVIDRVIQEKPDALLKVIASIVPKELTVTSATSDLTEAQMENALAIVGELIAARDAGSGFFGGVSAPTHEGSGTA